jgi:hypothetical protein
MKWIESKEGLIIILKHGEDIAKNYQYHIDNNDDQGPLDFDIWLEEFEDEVEWQQSDELKLLMSKDWD